MPTLSQISAIHSSLGSQNSIPEYLEALNKIGVLMYDSFITDGHSEYHCSDGQTLIGEPEHEKYEVAKKTDKENFLKQLQVHAEGKTTYEEMSRRVAASGVEKWRFDTVRMTMEYYDWEGKVVLTEQIE